VKILYSAAQAVTHYMTGEALAYTLGVTYIVTPGTGVEGLETLRDAELQDRMDRQDRQQLRSDTTGR
jgi:hypothetical protein